MGEAVPCNVAFTRLVSGMTPGPRRFGAAGRRGGEVTAFSKGAAMDGERGPRWVGVALASAVGLGTLALLLWGSVTIGAGDSEGRQRPVRDILRAADRALASTGWSDGWRMAAWACGGAAVAGGVVLVWAAAGLRDAALPNETPGAGPDSLSAGDQRRYGSNGGAGSGSIGDGPDPSETRSDASTSGRPA